MKPAGPGAHEKASVCQTIRTIVCSEERRVQTISHFAALSVGTQSLSLKRLYATIGASGTGKHQCVILLANFVTESMSIVLPFLRS